MSASAVADLGQAALHDLHGHVRAQPVAERLGPDPPVQRREDVVALQPGQPRLHGVAGQPEPLRQRHDAGARVLGQGEQQPRIGGVDLGHVAQSDMRGRPTSDIFCAISSRDLAQIGSGVVLSMHRGVVSPCVSGATPRRRHVHHRRAAGDPGSRGRRRGEFRDRAAPGHRGGRPRTRGGGSPPPAAAGPGPAAHARGRAGRAPRLRARHQRRRAARALPRPRARPPVGRRGDRAAAPGRAGHLGLAARPGGRAGRRRPRAAAPTTWPSRPTASTASPGPAASTRCT